MFSGEAEESRSENEPELKIP